MMPQGTKPGAGGRQREGERGKRRRGSRDRLRLVVLDLDGTLLDGHRAVAAATARLIRLAAARGVRFLLASARPPCSMLPFHRGLGLDAPLCCFNGALVQTATGETWLREPLPAATATGLARWCAGQGLYAKVFGEDVFWVARATAETVAYSGAYLVPYAEVGDLGAFLAETGMRPYAVVVHTEPGGAAALEEAVRARFGGEVAVHVPNDHAVHLSAPAASKVAAARLVARRLGVAARECLAVGDGDNDVELIRWAGVGAAVANASPALARAAAYVAGAPESAGVAEVLRRFLAPDPGPDVRP